MRGGTRRFIAGALLALLGAVSAMLAVSTGVAAAAGGGCTAAQLVPTAHVDTFAPAGSQMMISQGLPTYSNSTTNPTTLLVRGKDTLVRLFLTLPSCAKSQSITVTGGSISVSNGATALGSGSLFSTVPDALPVSYTGTPPANFGTDPVFVVPGKVLTPCGSSTSCPTNTAGFTATFNVSLSYTATGVTGTQTATFSDHAAVAQKSNALRLLVVPMGNATAPNTRATQYSANADSALQKAMNTLSRIYPVPCAADPSDSTGSCFNSNIASSFGGIRYSVSPGLLDLSQIAGAYDSNGKFCGGQTNFDAIKAALAQFMQSFNTTNPSTPADRVVGVVDEAISDGITSSPTGASCAEGMASAGASAAWARAVYSVSPSYSGGVLAMEIEHTFGGVPYPRSTTYHSTNSAADGTAPNRAMNVTQRAQVGSPRTFMQYNTTLPWNNDTTVGEQLDSQFLLCNLGGPTDTECATAGTTGSTTGIGAGSTLVMSGTTDGTVAGTNVVESYFSTNVAQPSPPDPGAPNPSSSYRLVQLTSAGALVNDAGVTVSFQDSDHDANGPNGLLTTPLGVFSTAFQGFSGVGQLALWYCGSSPSSACLAGPSTSNGGVLLYSRSQQATPPSASFSPSGTFTDYSQHAGIADITAAVHGSAIAWATPPTANGVSAIRVGPVSSSANAVLVPTTSTGAQTQPTWRTDGKAIAFAAGGNLWTVSVDTSTTPFTLGTPVQVYSSTGSNPKADNPTWFYDGTTNPPTSRIYYDAANGGLRVLSPGGMTNPVPNTSAHESSPSVSPTGTQLAIVLQTNQLGPDIFVKDASNGNVTQLTSTGNSIQPFWGDDGRIYFTRAGNVWSIKTDGTGLTQITTTGADANPTESSGRVALDRPYPNTTSDREIMLSGFGGSVTSSSAELDLVCPNGTTFPVAVGIPAAQVNAAIANFTQDPSRNCGGGTGTLVLVPLDGFTRGPAATIQLIYGNTAPTIGVVAPSGLSIGPNAKMPLNGSASSPQDGSLRGVSLKWYLVVGSTKTLLGTGNQLDAPPPSGGWPCGTQTIELDATDSGGRTSSATTTVFVDCTTPAVSITSGPSGSTNSSTATFVFGATDPDNGASQITYTCELDLGPAVPCTSPVTYTGLADGTHTVFVYASDPALNLAVTSFTWTVDATPPATTAAVTPTPNAAGWNNTNPTVTLTATDPTSGVASITYSLSGATTQAPTVVPGSTASITGFNVGATTVSYYATDNVGNVETTHTLVVRFDNHKPTTTISTFLLALFSMNGTAQDDVSGVASTTVCLRPGTATTGDCSYTIAATLSNPGGLTTNWSADLSQVAIGIYTATASSVDVAGNQGDPSSALSIVIP